MAVMGRVLVVRLKFHGFTMHASIHPQPFLDANLRSQMATSKAAKVTASLNASVKALLLESLGLAEDEDALCVDDVMRCCQRRGGR